MRMDEHEFPEAVIYAETLNRAESWWLEHKRLLMGYSVWLVSDENISVVRGRNLDLVIETTAAPSRVHETLRPCLYASGGTWMVVVR